MKRWKNKIAVVAGAVFAAGIICVGGSVQAQAASIQIPAASTEVSKIGATMPYTRYDSTAAVLGGGAKLVTSANFAKDNIASQASEQSYIALPKSGAYAQWTLNTAGNGVTMRFTLPDSSDGMGQDGSLDIYVNNKKVQTVDLSSYNMWQYFPSGNPQDTPGGTACFAFDETHFLLKTSLKKGDTIKVVSTGKNNLEYGVDFLEIEKADAQIAKPANAYSIDDYGADGTDEYDDYGAISKCITAAKKDGKDVYIPAGNYRIGQIWRIDASNIKITGAGMWYTNLLFTSADRAKGGISGATATNVEFSNMYINSRLRSRYNENAAYKCFMDVWNNCYIHDIWEDHFECGFWMADYVRPMEYSDGVVIANCRIRNNLADGVNFCQGTSNATVYNCSIRNNGDDGLAMWSNNYLDAKNEQNNVFCYNTIDFIWRAGGIAIYGGNGHKVYNNYIADTFMASGIHINTVFDGYKFTQNSGMELSNNILVRCGTSSDSWNSVMGAVDLLGDVRNVTFNNTYIYDAQHDGIRICNSPSNIVFNNTTVYGCGKDGATTSSDDTGAVVKYEYKNSTKSITFNGITYAGSPYADMLYGSRVLSTITNEKNQGNSYQYKIPAGTSKNITSPVSATAKVGATKVQKVTKKTKVAKKVSITLKKVSGATGYQVKISTNKKFQAKKTITKKVKKNTFTVSHKKLKKAATVYVKARAYKTVGKTTTYGAWSKSKTGKAKK